MATYAVSLNGQSYNLTTADPAQIAAIAAARARKNEGVAEEDVISTDAGYLQFVFAHWAATNPGFNGAALQTAFAAAAASYAGQDIPAPEAEEVTPEVRKAQLQAYAATKRYSVEQGGVTVPGVGRIPSDDRAKLMLMGAALGMADNTSAPLVLGATSVTLTKAQFQGLYAAIVGHVKGCFEVQTAVLEAIEAEEITEEAEIDAAAWPAN